jgi:Asp-tRNA(Asn)/Glu-tRNA(Gln) amidotransferase A subunit family amidase
MTDLTFAPAHHLAQMIRDRRVSSLEVVEAYLSKISQHNSQLNAICTLDAEKARSRATAADLALDKGETGADCTGCLSRSKIFLKQQDFVLRRVICR